MLLVTKEPTVKKNISEMDEKELKRAMEMQEKFVWKTGPKMLSFWEAAYDAVYVKMKEEKESMLMDSIDGLSLEDLDIITTQYTVRFINREGPTCP